MENLYTVDYFIQKFNSLKESEVGTSQQTGCAYGQCRSRKNNKCVDGHLTLEGKALESLFKSLKDLTSSKGAAFQPYESIPARINNGDVEQYQQKSPKLRLLAALEDVKKLQKPKTQYKVVRIANTILEQELVFN